MTSAPTSRRSARSPRTRRAAPVSALAELETAGRLGPEGAKLLYRVVRTVAFTHGYPPPEGHRAWDDNAISEVAHDFVTDERSPRRLTYLAVHAVDADSFERLFHQIVLNFFRDGGRRTEIGRLMLRLRDVLSQRDEFVGEAGDRWRMASQRAEPSSVAPQSLIDAASAEAKVDVPRWSPQTRRRPPVADAASLERLCRRVLEAAQGTVPLDQLARSIAPRLGLIATPVAQPVDNRNALETVASSQHADASLDGIRAREIFGALTERERLLLAAVGTPVRELRSVIGVGSSQAAELAARLRAVLAVELRDDEGYEAVFFHLVDQAKAWAAARPTGRPDAIPRLMNAT